MASKHGPKLGRRLGDDAAQSTSAHHHWGIVSIIFLFGVIGPSAIGKLIPLSQDYIQTFGGTPAGFGWLISSIALLPVFLAIPSGLIVDRFGSRLVLIAGAFSAIVANVLYILFPSILGFQLARFLDGLAVCLIYTAGPVYLIAWSSAKRQAATMGVWTMYTPVGMSVGLVLGGMFARTEAWTSAFWAHGLLACAIGIIGIFVLPDLRDQSSKAPSIRAQLFSLKYAYSNLRLLMLSAVFFMVIGIGVGAGTALPSYISATDEVSIGAVSGLMAITNLAMIPGSLIAGFYLAKLVGKVQIFAAIMAGTFVVLALVLWPSANLSIRFAALIFWSFLSGASVAMIMTMLPHAAGQKQLGVASSMLNQAGSAATLAMPPVWFALTASQNVTALISLIGVSVLLSVLSFYLLNGPTKLTAQTSQK